MKAAAQEDTVDYWLERAGEYENNDDLVQAVSACDKALKIDPEDAEILIRKAFLLGVMGKANASIESPEKALELLDQELNKDPDNAGAWQNRATVLSTLEREDESIEASEKALAAFGKRTDEDPNDVEAWIEKAWILKNLGRWDEAREAYDGATETVPQSHMAWRAKAKFLNIIGETNESMKAYDRAIELIPANETALLFDVWAEKSDSLMSWASWEDALAAQEKALELGPQYSTMWALKAHILLNLGRDIEALEAYDEAIKRNPASVWAWRGRASLLAETKRFNESLAAYEEIIKLTDENDTEELAQTWMDKGQALAEAGRHAEAVEAWERSLGLFDEAVGKAPGDIYLQQSKGVVLFELGRYEDALDICNGIIEGANGSGLADIWVDKGGALRALVRNREALEAYNRAIDIFPLDDSAWVGRVEAQKALGQAYNATWSLQVAKELKVRA